VYLPEPVTDFGCFLPGPGYSKSEDERRKVIENWFLHFDTENTYSLSLQQVTTAVVKVVGRPSTYRSVFLDRF